MMAMRPKRRASSRIDRHARLGAYKDGFVDGEGEDLLPDITAARKLRKKRNCWNYCVFGGISGLTILFVHLLHCTRN